jgi:hypothetical protein
MSPCTLGASPDGTSGRQHRPAVEPWLDRMLVRRHHVNRRGGLHGSHMVVDELAIDKFAVDHALKYGGRDCRSADVMTSAIHIGRARRRPAAD